MNYPENVDPSAPYCPWNDDAGYDDEPQGEPFQMPVHAAPDEGDDFPF